MIRLPATLPGLLHRGSPCVDNQYGGGVLIAVGEEVATLGVMAGVIEDIPFEDLELDLTDATGRVHAAWWLLGVATAGRPGTYRQSDWFLLSFRWEMPPRKRLPKWRYRRMTIGHLCLWNSSDQGDRWPVCPALDALDPDDPRTLDDGSRWVDAEALRLVCLHVAEKGP